MTATLERPDITHPTDRAAEPRPMHRPRRRLLAISTALALLAGGVTIGINAASGTEGPTAGQIAYGQRLEQMAANYTPPLLTHGQIAEAQRWTEHAQYLGSMLTPAQQAEAARWQARAAAELGLSQGQQATADRYQGLADNLTRGRRAEAERWQALADTYD